MLKRTAAIHIKPKQKAWKVPSLLHIVGVKIQLSINIKTYMCQLLKNLPEPAKISESLKHFWLCYELEKVHWKLLLRLNWISSKVCRFIMTKKIPTVIKNKISFKKQILKYIVIYKSQSYSCAPYRYPQALQQSRGASCSLGVIHCNFLWNIYLSCPLPSVPTNLLLPYDLPWTNASFLLWLCWPLRRIN